MKKGFALFCAALMVFAALPALAQSTGVNVDGTTYVITGGDGTYQLNGMTFIIEGNEVVVRREGEEDLHMLLEPAEETDAVMAGTGDLAGTYTESVIVQTTGVAEVGTAERVITYSCFEEDGTVLVEAISEDDTVSWHTFKEGDSAEEYSAYAKYGLSYDAVHDLLYYQGKLVRVMEDSWELGGNMKSELQYFNDAGAVDVRTLRNEAGVLTGLEALSDAAFAARDLTAWTEPSVTRMEMTATDGKVLSREERRAFFEPYAAFGLRYDDENDLLFYQDRLVRKFVDVRVSNGEALEGGKFEGEMTQLVYADGEVDVTTVRDYSQTAAGEEGTLIGMHVEEIG